jgi:hypothetical protein
VDRDPYFWQRLLRADAETAIAATWRSTLDGVPYDVTYRMVTRDGGWSGSDRGRWSAA